MSEIDYFITVEDMFLFHVVTFMVWPAWFSFQFIACATPDCLAGDSFCSEYTVVAQSLYVAFRIADAA